MNKARLAVMVGALAALGALDATFTSALAQSSRHEGYYYPRVTSRETFVSRATTFEDSDRTRRLLFVNTVTKQLSEMAYAPQYAIFAKGDEADRLIIVAYGEGVFNTIYRARALFATLTSHARLTPGFQEFAGQDWFTFFDLAKLLGYRQITISDGNRFAHQVKIE